MTTFNYYTKQFSQSFTFTSPDLALSEKNKSQKERHQRPHWTCSLLCSLNLSKLSPWLPSTPSQKKYSFLESSVYKTFIASFAPARRGNH